VVTTRRGLFAAGAGAAVLAGCVPKEEPTPSAAEALGAVVALQRGLVGAYERMPGRYGGELGARTADLADRLERAGARASGPVAPPDGDPLEAALALERRALGAAVAATGALSDAASLGLAADAVTSSAQHAAILLGRLGRDPLEMPFPDGSAA
jgi:hypothetical protein